MEATHYPLADISKEQAKMITEFEQQMKSACGKDVVLIAYEDKK